RPAPATDLRLHSTEPRPPLKRPESVSSDDAAHNFDFDRSAPDIKTPAKTPDQHNAPNTRGKPETPANINRTALAPLSLGFHLENRPCKHGAPRSWDTEKKWGALNRGTQTHIKERRNERNGISQPVGRRLSRAPVRNLPLVPGKRAGALGRRAPAVDPGLLVPVSLRRREHGAQRPSLRPGVFVGVSRVGRVHARARPYLLSRPTTYPAP